MVETAILEKLVKNRLAVAAEHFNRDYKKGFQYLQVVMLCLAVHQYVQNPVLTSAGMGFLPREAGKSPESLVHIRHT